MSDIDILNVISICLFVLAIYANGVVAGLCLADWKPADPKSKPGEQPKGDGK